MLRIKFEVKSDEEKVNVISGILKKQFGDEIEIIGNEDGLETIIEDVNDSYGKVLEDIIENISDITGVTGEIIK